MEIASLTERLNRQAFVKWTRLASPPHTPSLHSIEEPFIITLLINFNFSLRESCPKKVLHREVMARNSLFKHSGFQSGPHLASKGPQESDGKFWGPQ
jgi:hypothetical protein